VAPLVNEQRLHFDGAILDRWGLVLDRHRREGWSTRGSA
jgi:hypothetical protein